MKTILNSTDQNWDVILVHFDRPVLLSPNKDDYDWHDKSAGIAKTKTEVDEVIIMWEDNKGMQRKFFLKKGLLDKINEAILKIHGKSGEPDCPY